MPDFGAALLARAAWLQDCRECNARCYAVAANNHTALAMASALGQLRTCSAGTAQAVWLGLDTADHIRDVN